MSRTNIAPCDEARYKVGLIGCGRWGLILKQKLVNLGVLAWSGGRDLLPLNNKFCDSKIPSVNWIVISTPPTTHFSLALQALNAGKNVFLEKPATVSLTETVELFSKAKQML